MTDSLFPPKAVALNPLHSQLELIWRDDSRSQFAGAELRRHCACASCRAATAPLPATAAIADLELIGSRGLQIKFSDGHQRGIFPWAYLHAIAKGRAEAHLHG